MEILSQNGSNSRHHVVNYFNNLESFRMIAKYNYLMNNLIDICKLISEQTIVFTSS